MHNGVFLGINKEAGVGWVGGGGKESPRVEKVWVEEVGA